MTRRTGGRILVDNLLARHVGRVFCVPGESFLPALEAFRQSAADIDLVVCRHEGGAGFMAEAHGKLTGRPGVAFVTRGPGVANAAIALHVARQDSTPLVLLVGQVGRGMAGREAFQEIDHRKFLSEVTKWTDQVEDPARLPEYVARAFAVAMSGRRGPVALILPEDVLAAEAETLDVPPMEAAEPAAAQADLGRLHDLLAGSERPLMIVGGSGWSEAACRNLARFAAAFDLPVAAGFRCQDRLDNDDCHYVGELGTSLSPSLADVVESADLILAVGDRLGEMATAGYRLICAPVARQRLVHVLPGAEELGRVYRADLAINAAVGPFLAAAANMVPAAPPRWSAWTAAARAGFEAASASRQFGSALELGEVMAAVRARLGADAIVTHGAGNYTGWVQRLYRFRRYPSQIAPASGAMGYGLPAAIAAKAAFPDRDVVCFAGDGCFLMTGQELATAVRHRLAIVVIVFDNGQYGTIRMHQERRYPGHAYGSDLFNPHFADLGTAYGAYAERVERTEAFAPAFDRALRAGRPALIHLATDPEVISTRATVAELRASVARLPEEP